MEIQRKTDDINVIRLSFVEVAAELFTIKDK